MAFVLVPMSNGGAPRRRPPFFATKKLAIIGSTKSKLHAPWTDPSWTIASHPCSRPACKREPDWYFDLHRPECFTKQVKSWNSSYYTWLQHLQTPIFMQQEWPEIPMAVAYPFDRILAEFSSSATGRGYFTNHVAYLIALAMTEGVHTIGLFGCQYSNDTEHGVQRGSCEYWMGRFEQAGGKLVVAQPNNLLLQPKGYYGYESHDERGQLTPEYLSRVAAPQSKVTDHVEARPAMVTIDMDNPVGRPPLMKPPEGVEIAWDRSDHKHHV